VSALLIGILIFATLYLGTVALLGHRPAREVVGERLRQIEGSRTSREARLSLPFYERTLVPLVKTTVGRIMQLTPPHSVATVRRRLTMAGRWQSDPLGWIFLKWLVAGLLGGAAVLVGSLHHSPVPFRLVGAVAAGGIGYLWFEASLRRAIRRRQARVLKELPETLDLLTISVEAGLGLDQAFEVVTSRRPGPLTWEIRKYLEEVRLGADRRDALKAIATRTGVEELISLTAAVIQALEFGVGIAGVLRVQADGIRVRRRQRIEERAMKASIKLLFPLIFLLLPALFIVVAAPGFIRVYTEFIKPTQQPGSFSAPPAVGR
jgi:tight adherence protein C